MSRGQLLTNEMNQTSILYINLDRAADRIAEELKDLSLAAGDRRVIAAIDGRCTAGKTTLAEQISKRIPCTVFHMDDFFLRPEQRTPERLSEPGGNVDRERFISEIMTPLVNGDTLITLSAFDCKSLSLKGAKAVKPEKTVIIEGSYSCHPALWESADFHIFLTVDPDEQKKRIIARNGIQGYTAFREKWIPLEEVYFEAFEIQQRCEECFRLS